MRIRQSQRRGAFTLLEVVLAMAIGMLLLVGLYVALDIQLDNTDAGRVVVHQTKVARGVLTRISNDISLNLGPVNPSSQAGSGSQGAGAAGAAAPAAGSAGTPGTTGATGNSGMGGSTGAGAAVASGGGLGPVNFNLGVQGDSATLTLYVSRLPRDATGGTDSNDPSVAQPSDLRRITYWLAGDPASPLGLARQEVEFVTSNDQINVVPPDVPDPGSFVIAEEVKSLQFQYFDGQNWQDTWDGTQPGSDGVTPMGPPALIAITLTVARTSPGGRSQDDPNPRQYRHVVAIPTANNFNAQPPTTSGTTNQGTTGSNQ
jgi:hypothetical protein